MLTPDYIDFHASERPDAIALIVNGRPISYAEFSRDIRKFTRALRGFALPPGSEVAVLCDAPYTHWLLLMAFERLGIATASPDGRSVLRYANMGLVLSEPQFRVSSPGRQQSITPEWIESVLALPPDDAPGPTVPSDATVRITWTSGTTGAPKRLNFSLRLFAAWRAKWTWLWGLTPQSRYLVTMSFSVGGVYACAAGCLCAGATVVHDRWPNAIQALISNGITHVLLLPILLRNILDELPQDCAKPAHLIVSSFGAGLSDSLRERALARLAGEVWDMYGANEVDWVCATSKASVDGVKTLLPGVHAQVVDERDEPLPEGMVGRLRVKTPRMVDGYVDNPEATRRMFKDGWFYPGDLAILRGGRGLQIIGRGDELLNIGGQKIDPVTIEDRIREIVGVRDVGVCSRRNQDGIEEICIAVSGTKLTDDQLMNGLRQALQGGKIGLFLVLRMEEIPRNPTGKVLRHRLREAFKSSVPASKEA